jgi:long-chain acyl-CoA synthetase
MVLDELGDGQVATVRSGERRITVAELNDRAARAASALSSTGARDGGAIAILLRNDVAFLEALFAAHFVGACAVPMNWHLAGDDVEYILRDCGATHLVLHADLLASVLPHVPEGVLPVCVATPPEVAEAFGGSRRPAAPPPGHLEWNGWLAGFPALARRSAALGGTMSYTSGTTGRPKGVRRRPVSSRRRAAVAEQGRRWFGNRPGMRTAIVGPLYHSVQNSYAVAAVRTPGSSVVITPRFDAEQVLRLISDERLTHLHLVPTMMHRLLQLPPHVRRRYDVSSLEFVVHGSAPCPPHVKRGLIEWWGPVLHEYYGTSEAGMVSRASSDEWLQREGTVGRAWPGRVVRIYDEAGHRLPPGVEGEVYMSLGLTPDFVYQNAPAARAAIERDGLITCGDIGYLDEDGYLFICDRKRDMAISGGVNIYPAEVEAVLSRHPDVRDCAVFGVPDEEYGEALAAAVQLHPGSDVTPTDLRAWAAGRMASFKVPRTFEIRESLPRDDSGKILKRLLREPHWAAAGRRI